MPSHGIRPTRPCSLRQATITKFECKTPLLAGSAEGCVSARKLVNNMTTDGPKKPTQTTEGGVVVAAPTLPSASTQEGQRINHRLRFSSNVEESSHEHRFHPFPFDPFCSISPATSVLEAHSAQLSICFRRTASGVGIHDMLVLSIMSGRK